MEDYFTFLCERVLTEIQTPRPALVTPIDINLDAYYEAMALDYLVMNDEDAGKENDDQ